jgi:hypothetical protein
LITLLLVVAGLAALRVKLVAEVGPVDSVLALDFQSHQTLNTL